MRLATKYALAGLLWGLVLGYGAVAVTTGLGIVVLFTLVYGAGPWGDNTGSVLYGLAVLGWTGSAVFCAALGYVHGRRLQLLPASAQGNEHRRAHLIAAAAVLTALLGGYQLHARNAALTIRQNYLEEALQARHEIYALSVTEDGDGRGIDIAVGANGRREGHYILELSVHDGRRALYVQRVELNAGAYEIHKKLSVGYKLLVPSAEGALVEGERGERNERRQVLAVTARLTPLLDARELRTLPRHAAQNYLADDSPFHSSLSTTHGLRWIMAEGRRWVVGQDGVLHEVQP